MIKLPDRVVIFLKNEKRSQDLQGMKNNFVLSRTSNPRAKAQNLSLPKIFQAGKPYPAQQATFVGKNTLVVNLQVIAFNELGQIGNVIESPVGILVEALG